MNEALRVRIMEVIKGQLLLTFDKEGEKKPTQRIELSTTMFIHLVCRVLPPSVDQVDLDLLFSHDNTSRKTYHLCKTHTFHYNLQSGHLPAGQLQPTPVWSHTGKPSTHFN